MRPAVLSVALLVAYPLLVLAGVVSGVHAVRIAGLASLGVAILLPGLLAGRPAAWSAAVLTIAGCAWLALRESSMLPLLLAPVLIPAGVAWVFGRTLRADRVPLIVQLVRHLHEGHGPVADDRIRYARRLTIAWTLLLAGLALFNAALGLLVTPGGFLDSIGQRAPLAVSGRTWAIATGLLGYVVVAVFFVSEYVYRQSRFPEQPYRDFRDFLRRSVAAAPSIVMDRELPASGSRIRK